MRPLFMSPYPKHRILPADSGDEVVPNPTVAFALEQRVLNRFLDTLGAASTLHVRWPTGPPVAAEGRLKGFLDARRGGSKVEMGFP